MVQFKWSETQGKGAKPRAGDKELNFIWIGPKALPDAYFAELLKTAKQADNYKVVLWIDPPLPDGSEQSSDSQRPLFEQLKELGQLGEGIFDVRSVKTLRWSDRESWCDDIEEIHQALREVGQWAAITDFMRIAVLSAPREAGAATRFYSELDHKHPPTLDDIDAHLAYGFRSETGGIYSQVLGVNVQTDEAARVIEGIREVMAELLVAMKAKVMTFLDALAKLPKNTSGEWVEDHICKTFGILVESAIYVFQDRHPELSDNYSPTALDSSTEFLSNTGFLGIKMEFGRSWVGLDGSADVQHSNETKALRSAGADLAASIEEFVEDPPPPPAVTSSPRAR